MTASTWFPLTSIRGVNDVPGSASGTRPETSAAPRCVKTPARFGGSSIFSMSITLPAIGPAAFSAFGFVSATG